MFLQTRRAPAGSSSQRHYAAPDYRLGGAVKPRWILLAGLVLACAVAGGTGYWWSQNHKSLPDNIASGNGRIEADSIDIDTKFAGRIAELMVDEGDMVKAGQILARMDTRDLAAALKKAEAQAEQAQEQLAQARAVVDQRKSEVSLAESEFERYRILLQKGNTTEEQFDRNRQILLSARAALTAANANVGEATSALDAAGHNIEMIQVNIADNTLVAPRDGRVQYRIADVGEVLGAGGKVFTMLDIADVYMNIYLPTEAAGRVQLGSDARIVLDAYPAFPVPARVTFIATEAQFTPKTVETKSERDKLMFRVKLRVDPLLLRAHAAEVRTGLPGVGYVLLDPQAQWPVSLQKPAQ